MSRRLSGGYVRNHDRNYCAPRKEEQGILTDSQDIFIVARAMAAQNGTTEENSTMAHII